MKLDKQTVEIFANLSKLNPGIVIKAGNVIKSRAAHATVPVVKVEFSQVQFPQDFALYDLNKFLSVLSFLNDPELSFTQSHLQISDPNGRNATIRFTQPTMVKHVDYSKELSVDSIGVDGQFDLSVENLKYLVKAAGAFNAPELAFVGNGEKIFVTTNDSKNDGIDKFEIEVGTTDKKFKIIINVSFLQLLSRSYTVKFSFKGLIEFHSSNEHNTIQYWITADEKSKVS